MSSSLSYWPQPISSKSAVTVIVTVFQRTEFLEDALRGVLAQTYGACEIIVTDDSCSKAIEEIALSFLNPLIRYRCNSTRLGVARNLKAAIQEARGEFIAILNDDDVWEPSFLEEVVSPLVKDEQIAIAFCDHWIVKDGVLDQVATEENTMRYGRSHLPVGIIHNPIGFVLEKNGVPLAMASMIRKNAIDWNLLTEQVSGAYDFWISCLAVSAGHSLFYVPRRLTRYRVHDAMETVRKAPDKNLNMIFIYERLLSMHELKEERPLLTNRLAHSFFRVGRDELHFCDVRAARKYFWRSVRTKVSFKGILAFAVTYAPVRLLAWFGLTEKPYVAP